MIEIMIDCYDAKIRDRGAEVQIHARRVRNGMMFEVWDLDHKELVAVFKINNYDLKEFLKLAKALLDKGVELAE